MDFNIQTFLEKYYNSNEKIILACSTGADSMFLLYHILKTPFRKNLVACYLNHKTRAECDEEAKFLDNLGKKEGFKVELLECDIKRIQKNTLSKSFEELAREKRYDFLRNISRKYNSSKILTAHHSDDKIETFIFHMLRGSKLTGLINMTESSGDILRPLLIVDKQTILNYLQKNNLQYFEDSTNLSNTYTRNYIRNEIIPKFEDVHPEYKRNLQNLLSHFEEIKEHLDNEVLKFLGQEQDFSLKEFFKLSSLLQKETIRYMYYVSHNHSTLGLSEANIHEVLRFFSGKNNKTKKEIHNMKLFKDGDKIIFKVKNKGT